MLKDQRFIIFSKKRIIDYERLRTISEVLCYDFIGEIYQKKDNEKAQPKQTVFIAVEVDADLLHQLNLPDEFLRLVKKQK